MPKATVSSVTWLSKTSRSQSRESAGGRIPADADVDELHLAIGIPQQRVVLDQFAVLAGGRNAVPQKRDRVAVTNGKVVGRDRTIAASQREQKSNGGE